MGILQDKIGVVTGAGQGIGRAIAMSYAREGANVVIADFNADSGEETAALIRDAGGEAAFIQGDVSKEDSVKAMVDFALRQYGRLDIACNSAAVSRGSGPIHEYQREVFDATLEMCLTNTWLCMKYEIAAMLQAGGGAIVNISSNSSLRGQAYNTAYAAAKGGVINYTRNLALDYALDNIRVNAVSPGLIETPLTGPLRGHPDSLQAYMDNIPMSRAGQPEEIAKVMLFLASDLASYVTGQEIAVDGGVTAWNGQPRFTRIFGDITIP